ncbi:hypothetical protein [Sphingomonas crocodyli]|uniref:Uncharacterized protein n=1 Tax=Sphingomonas crocodyli TaxID=1979270 RepID=A0A437M4V4_9SPHN|nr:hypothetical protein [Sphingomonas crocodyli]RVT92718.1 hypothetical protein EOD43_02005 [Sphingomonas crocodyli]
MSIHAHPIVAADIAPARVMPRGMSVAWLLAALLGWLALDLVLLLRFLGFAQPALYLAAAVAVALLVRAIAREDLGRIAWRRVGLCIAIALLLCALGGEGRFFYANVDWQVRDAVLRDMAIHPWPFVYAGGDLLRAPLGMYFVPGLAAKAGGQGAGDVALLAQNGLLIGLLLAIGSTLFESGRARMIALAVFLGFSGLDIVGQLLRGHIGGFAPTAHLEGWGFSQFSSTITLIFWVPQHALAGWVPALAYLLWRSGRLRSGVLFATLPLVALWSPFGTIGALPFAFHALLARRIGWRDLGAVIPATLLALPALLYLAAAPDAVGVRFYPIPLGNYVLFELVEAVPFLIAGWAWRARFGGVTLLIVGLCLAVAPLVQIGWSIDFAMRASIPALAILAVHLGDRLAGMDMPKERRAMLLRLLAIGSITGLCEIARAVTFPTSPVPHCGFSRAWDETFGAYPKGSYLAPIDRVPAAIRPVDPAVAADRDPLACYDRAWRLPPMFL